MSSNVLDRDRVDALTLAAFDGARLSKTSRTGRLEPDAAKFKDRVFATVTSRLVTNRRDKSENTWTPGELYAAVFPGAPGTKAGADLDAEQREARARLVRRTWNLTNPSPRGYVQKRLGDTGEGKLVLCRTVVLRTYDDVPGCYVTEDPALIIAEGVVPQLERFVQQAFTLNEHIELIRHRQPELAPEIARQLRRATKRALAALATHNRRPSAATLSEISAA